MRTVGQVLKETREAKLYSLEEVEKVIKIRKELLIALENDDFSKLPPPTFVRGFIRNYAKFLDLDGEKLLAIFRREFSEKKHKPYVMDAFANPVPKSKLEITPTRILGLVISLIIISFFAYLWIQYRELIGPPPLTVMSPRDQYTTDNPVITVEGKTDPEVVIMVNSQEISVDSSGVFKKEITLYSQVNKLTIVATSKFNQKTQLEKTIYLKR